MKKILILLCLLSASALGGTYQRYAGAEKLTTIKLHILSPQDHNRYFLCIPFLGCFSTSAGYRGRAFSFIFPFAIPYIMIADTDYNLLESKQSHPLSCPHQVKLGETITFYGEIETINRKSTINHFSCNLTSSPA